MFAGNLSSFLCIILADEKGNASGILMSRLKRFPPFSYWQSGKQTRCQDKPQSPFLSLSLSIVSILFSAFYDVLVNKKANTSF